MAKMIKKIPCLPFLSIVLMILFALGSCEDEMQSLKKEHKSVQEEALTRETTNENPIHIIGQDETDGNHFDKSQN